MEGTFEFKKNIVFFGMPDMAYAVLSLLHNVKVNIVAVVCPPASNSGSATFQLFVNNMGYKIIVPKEDVSEQWVVDEVKKLNADLGIVASYTQKFSDDLISSFKDGVVNTHPSLLPEYKGANPYSHVIFNSEKTTGVTIHRMTDKFDSGNVLMQKSVEIEKNETMGTLFNKLNTISAELLLQFLVAYETQGMVEGITQESINKNPKFKAKGFVQGAPETIINWNNPAVEIERQLRALNPFFYAATSFQGVTMKVFTADVLNMKSKYEPGTICAIGDTIDVATGDGILKIRSLQLGSFLVGDARDFSDRVKINVGMKLGI